MVTVYDFVNMCITDEQRFRIYDMHKEENIWEGEGADLPYELGDATVWSFDSVMPFGDKPHDGVITLNIDSSDEE